MKKALVFFMLALFFFGLIGESNIFAGAWTKEKGEIYDESLFTFYFTRHVFDKRGHLNSLGGRFSKEEFNEYLEYGVTKKITAIGNFFYDILQSRQNGTNESNNGFTTNELGLRYGVLDRPVVASLQQLISIPSRFNSGGELPLTNGQIDLETRILIGKYLNRIKTYFNFENGIRFRLEGPADEYRLQALIGYKGLNPLELIAQYDAILGFHNGENTKAGNNVTINPEFDLHRLSGTVLLHVHKHVALKTQGFVHVAGENTGEGWGITSGLVLDF